MTTSMGWNRRAVAIALLVVAAFLVQGLAPGAADASTRRRDTMLSLTNEDRADRNRDALSLDARLSRYAKHHSKDMAEKGYLFHTPDLASRLKGRNWSVGGENVGVGSTLKVLERAFMRSKPHRRNILRSAFDHAAVGVYRASGKLWVTVIFYG